MESTVDNIKDKLFGESMKMKDYRQNDYMLWFAPCLITATHVLTLPETACGWIQQCELSFNQLVVTFKMFPDG